jgi:hypothetical protein
MSSRFIDVKRQPKNRQPKSSADVWEPPRSNQRRLARVLGFADPMCCTIPTGGYSACAADCTGRLTVGMMSDFADGEARAATALHAEPRQKQSIAAPSLTRAVRPL